MINWPRFSFKRLAYRCVHSVQYEFQTLLIVDNYIELNVFGLIQLCTVHSLFILINGALMNHLEIFILFCTMPICLRFHLIFIVDIIVFCFIFWVFFNNSKIRIDHTRVPLRNFAGRCMFTVSLSFKSSKEVLQSGTFTFSS